MTLVTVRMCSYTKCARDVLAPLIINGSSGQLPYMYIWVCKKKECILNLGKPHAMPICKYMAAVHPCSCTAAV